MKGWFFFTVLGLLSTSVVDAKEPLPVSIWCNEIKAIQPTEIDGDELYIDVEIRQANQVRNVWRVPQKPGYWSSHRLSALKPFVVWSGSIAEGDEVIAYVSLVEMDANPLNPDDVIGTVRVTMQNKQGMIQAQWSRLNEEEGEKGQPLLIEKEGHIFKFKTSKAVYMMDLSLKPHAQVS